MVDRVIRRVVSRVDGVAGTSIRVGAGVPDDTSAGVGSSWVIICMDDGWVAVRFFMVDRVTRRVVSSVGGVAKISIRGCGSCGRNSFVTRGSCVSAIGVSGFFAPAESPTSGLPAVAASSVRGVSS